ncbi:exonuclease domain-containing protein [soil metagenome]
MFAIIDTETTGGNPAKDKVMEIAIILHDGERVVDEFSTLINPKVPIAPFIKKLTGINDSMVKNAPTFEEVSDKILEMTKGSIFVAHNVGFDYGVLRNEFRRMGIRFDRKQLCTVKFSREVLPGCQSYSLGKLCREIGIVLEGRHRAYGDAAATAKLFTRLLEQDHNKVLHNMLEIELTGLEAVPNLNFEVVEDLPEDTGVFSLIDKDGKVLFLSKGRNLRKRVIELLTKDLSNSKYDPLRQAIADITYEVTGSELVAQLLETEEVIKQQPSYNPAQRRRNYRYGVYHFTDDWGFINLHVDMLVNRVEERPLVEFTTRKSATSVLKRMVQRHGLYSALCGFGENGNGKPDVPPNVYNGRLNQLLEKYQYDSPNFFIIGEGRSHHEQSVVWIENHRFMGCGYFEPEYIENDIESIKSAVARKADTPDAHRIIRNWMGRKNQDTVIVY